MTLMARVTDNKNDQDKMTGTTGMTLRITWNTRMTGMTRMTWMTSDDWCELVGQDYWDDCDKRDVVAEVGHNQAKINVGCFCQCKTIFYTRQQLAGVIYDFYNFLSCLSFSFQFLTAFLDTDLSRGNGHEWDTQVPCKVHIPTESPYPWRQATPLGLCPLLFSNSGVGSFTSDMNRSVKVL